MPAPSTRSRTGFSLVLVLALALAATVPAALPGAAAAEPPAEPPVDAAAETRAADVTRYRFDDELVRGGVPAPTAEHLYVRRRSDRESLVRVRTQFVDELLESAELL